MSKHKIFISYSHKDNKHLEILLKYMKFLDIEEVCKIWIDKDTQGGDEWDNTMEKSYFIEAPYLQLVCQTLWDVSDQFWKEQNEEKQRAIKLETYKNLKKKKEL